MYVVTDFCSSWYKCLWSDNNNSYWIASQVNTNGVISFRLPFLEYMPERFPLKEYFSPIFTPLIAPFWDDVDIRRFGTIFYRQTSNVTLLQRARHQLQELFPSSGNFTPTTLFIATWDRVAQFRGGSQVSAYMTLFLLVTITIHCNTTAWGTDIMGHYTNMEDCFIIYVL